MRNYYMSRRGGVGAPAHLMPNLVSEVAQPSFNFNFLVSRARLHGL